MKLTTLAWRNTWRNRRRALLTMASILFAVFFCSIMDSYADGVWSRQIENTLRTQNGHIEIHGKGYWNDKITDNFMSIDSCTLERLRAIGNVDNVSPRMETFALAALGNVSKGIGIVAVSPAQENAKSKLASRLRKGDYLAEYDSGVLIGEGLAKCLHAGVGDTLALIGQGHFGASAAGLFPVRGILHLIFPEADNGVVYMTTQAAQRFIDMPDGYSGVLITLKDPGKLEETMAAVSGQLPADAGEYEVLSWRFTMQRLMQTAETDKAFNKIVLFILYVIVGFGILGTVVMLTNERRKEFRTMISLGMSRGRLSRVVALELLLMALLGITAGVALALPIAWWFSVHPIRMTGDMAAMLIDSGMEPFIPLSTDAGIFVTQVCLVLILAAVAVIYPIRKIRKLKLTAK